MTFRDELQHAQRGKKDNMKIGIFYELPCGRIAKTYGTDGSGQRVQYYFDDEGGSHTASTETLSTWKPREDLADFPNARDPRLPYEFDLFWDIKYKSDLVRAINNNHDDLDSIREAMERHAIRI